MTTPDPITPPPELRSKWFNEAPGTDLYDYIIEQAAQWGAGQELEACCEWLEDVDCDDPQETAKRLRAARRPKPPSLKEEALQALKNAPGQDHPSPVSLLTAQEHALIRRALEALPE